MKSRIILIPAAILFLASCGPKPTADFSWSPAQPKVGETVSYINNSADAEKYDWNLGNMSISSEKEPQTVYNSPGNFIVDLTARNGTKSDTRTQTVTIAP